MKMKNDIRSAGASDGDFGHVAAGDSGNGATGVGGDAAGDAVDGGMGEGASCASRFRRAHIVSWALVVLWAGLIFLMSANTGSNLNNDLGFFSSIYQALKDVQAQLLGPDADAINSIAHFCEYAVFGALLANALRFHMPLRRACIVALVCASAYGATDEFHQYFVPERMCDPVDWAVDTLGGALGSALAFAVLRKRS